MIVLIDAGNTRIKLGWVAPDGQREAAILSLQHADVDQVSRWLGQLPRPPAAAVGVNVAGDPIANAITTQFKAHGCPITWIHGQNEALGIRNAYRRAGQLGADRWVSLIGLAWHDRTRRSETQTVGLDAPEPLMLASFGTATTIDTLVADPMSPSTLTQWTFPGGVIFPGPALMRSSLAAATANLPEADGDTAAYPTHTHQAIVTGIAAAQAGAVIRQWLIGLEQQGRAPAVYSTGGGWPMVQDETQRLLVRLQSRLDLPVIPVKWLSAPVLDGLACIALDSHAPL